MYFDLNRIIYFNIFFMVNLLKVKTIRNFINVVKIGIVLFKYWADRSNLFVYAFLCVDLFNLISTVNLLEYQNE